ncbi:nitroreductase family protein [Thalassoglobus sp.]|uniref:nitroreductase family protein n=1 Tax=Thalassoglobus sp. TaxID=2795869 RepID=UPI003AA9A1A7
MTNLPNPLEHRKSDHPIEELFLKRWSPRAMNGEAVELESLNRLFEAARWAPSTYNEQEWRFLFARNQTANWSTFFDLLGEANQAWCQKAGALVIVFSREKFTKNGKPNPVHQFDAGLATQNLLLQAASIGLVAHPMAGFDRGASTRALNVPDGFEPHCMIAIGHPGNPEDLPENYQSLEQPSGRKPIDSIAREGTFTFDE